MGDDRIRPPVLRPFVETFSREARKAGFDVKLDPPGGFKIEKHGIAAFFRDAQAPEISALAVTKLSAALIRSGRKA